MTWLTQTHQVTGAVLALAAFGIGATVAIVMGQYHDLANARWHQARTDACHESARARAAERPRRQQLAPSRRQLYPRIIPTLAHPPTDDELARLFICPFFDPPLEDRYLVHRRARQEAVA